jgi:hypothetical protein
LVLALDVEAIASFEGGLLRCVFDDFPPCQQFQVDSDRQIDGERFGFDTLRPGVLIAIMSAQPAQLYYATALYSLLLVGEWSAAYHTLNYWLSLKHHFTQKIA